MRRILVITAVLAATGAIAVLGTGAGEESGDSGVEIRAIFDNAFTLIEGEDVRVSGVNVGKITKLEVTRDNRAAVVMRIDRPGFGDFREDAKCSIRPQSLIGERYVECSLTEPRAQGEQAPPALEEIPEGQPGAGQLLLPVERTTKPVDLDLINNVNRLPERQRLAIILNELGAAVAGRSEDLNETIRRANPALGALNEVVEILGDQNQVLRDLATNSDQILAPLARDRARVASFIENANTVSQASAARRAELERSFERLPRFLTELRPTLQRLGSFSDEFQPVLRDLRAAAPSVNTMLRQLGPFSQAGIPAVRTLGEAADVGRPALLRSKPIIDDLARLTEQAAPVAKDLSDITTSLRDTGGIERLMDYIFYQASAVNGFDQFGHYLRAGLIVNTCSQYAASPGPGCSANYRRQTGANQQTTDPAAVASAFRTSARRAAQSTPARAAGRAKARTARERRALKLPSAMLPGQVRKARVQRAPATQQQQSTRDGLLDYLLGGGA